MTGSGASPGGSALQRDATQGSFVLRWSRPDRMTLVGGRVTDGLVPASGQARCLWARGHLANREELLARTGLPATSDTADILEALYRQVGPRAAEALAGTVAWVVWDPERRSLTVARDRFGHHGLFHAERASELLLAASVEPILGALEGRRPQLNEGAAVAHLLGAGLPPESTLYDAVSSLGPGELVSFGERALERSRYWRPSLGPLLGKRSDQEYAQAYREVLFRVAPQYLPSGPTAIALSGGLDSTSIAGALCVPEPPANLRAFTWVAPEHPQADEGPFARAVCEKLRLAQEEIRAADHLPLTDVDSIAGSPTGPVYHFYSELYDAMLERLRERGIHHLLAGAGGDNLFGGNVFGYPDLLLTGRWAELVRQLRAHRSRSQMSLAQIVRRMVLSPIKQAYWPVRPAASLPDWLTVKGRSLAGDEPVEAIGGRALPGRLQLLRQMRNPRVGRAMESLARRARRYGVELLHPLFDHRVIEFGMRLPVSQLFCAAERKVIVRRAMRGLLPDRVLDHHEKIYPVALFRRGLERERETASRLFEGMRLGAAGLVDEVRLRRSYDAYLAGGSTSSQFWHALTLEAWMRKHDVG